MLLLFVFTASCNGQIKTDVPKENINLPGITPDDNDPYFIETNANTTSHGPTSITRNIMQDRNGNIWLASWEGIIRYDGKTFTNFTNNEGLRRYHVFSVLEDSKGDLWFGTIGAGVYRYDGNTFTNFTKQEGLASDRVGCFLEDSAGNIWVGTDGGASRYDGKSFTNFTTKDGLANNDINSIIEDQNGKLWFGARGEACVYDARLPDGQGSKFTRFTNKEGMPFTNVRSIIEDQNGHIWLGGNDGLWRYSPGRNGGSFTNFTTNFVGYIFEDKKGNIWTSAEAGNPGTWALSRYDAQSLQDEKATPTEMLKQYGAMFFGILEDKEGGIWLGTGNGLCRYDGTSFNCFQDQAGKE